MEKTRLALDPKEVQRIISRYMQADGLDLVVDLEKSQGSYLYDAKRDQFFLDLFGCFATIPLGYNHPSLTSPEARAELTRAAIQKPSNSDVYTRPLAEFVETFSRVARPPFMKYLFFIEGGTLAVENALKAAFDWKVRKNLAQGASQERGFQVLHFQQAFHGRSGYTLSLTNTADPRKTQYFPKFNWPRIVNPKCTFPLEGQNLQRVVELEEQALHQIQEAIRRHGEDIACLILEPIQGEGGDNHFRPEFHRALRRICDEHQILMIYDEVQTGFGSTGRMWAFEYYVEPDLIAFGKKTQVCGMMASGRLDEVPDNVFHVSSRINSTWGGNLVDMVRCRLQLEVYEKEGIVKRSCRTGELLLRELQQLQREFPEKVSNVRGKGLFCAFDLPDGDLRLKFRQKLFENRAVILGCGDRSIRFRPALTIREEEVLEGIDLIRKTLKQL